MQKSCKHLLEEVVSLQNVPKMVLFVTGGGGHFFKWMMTTPGASNLLIEASIPYDKVASSELLQKYNVKIPSSYCSEEMAYNLATSALRRAVDLLILREGFQSESFHQLLGMGTTCSLKTNRPKWGQHCAFISTISLRYGIRQYYLPLQKDILEREEEDKMVSELMTKALADAVPYSMELSQGLRNACNDQEVTALPFDSSEILQNIASGDLSHAVYLSKQDLWLPAPTISGWQDRILCIFPGSFSPLHKGHEQLVEESVRFIQQKYKGKPIEALYEISLLNADKGNFSFDHIYRNAEHFRQKSCNLLITSHPLFLEKAKLFKGAYFLLGFDTVQRLVDPKYYGKSYENMIMSLSQIDSFGCRFVVAGRLVEEEYHTLSLEPLFYSNLPTSLHSLFTELPNFRIDLSSSEIRRARKTEAG
ncbi:hypothetical protein IE077_001155 [Cardiosporidium cionae]|uniref:Cytidyltransferase-like domain-containing protein n=1 Tax=Cardiosporidium cionae TaxID=476202 RepID=A0ABQ7JDH5_9APIC|nr:hypothetical protein IE077_001155 [Cardiosporidium cionae]|eukprot:KAF8822054.1 hypothetical protein IE077_001155 [Cardiosporidium cionae]